MNLEERKKFWYTLCSLDGKDIQSDAERLMKMMKSPRLLYRYRAVNDRTHLDFNFMVCEVDFEQSLDGKNHIWLFSYS